MIYCIPPNTFRCKISLRITFVLSNMLSTSTRVVLVFDLIFFSESPPPSPFSALCANIFAKRGSLPCSIMSSFVMPLKQKNKQFQSFIILAVLHQCMQRVCEAHFHVIAPSGNTSLFKEMLQRWRSVGNTVSKLTGPKFELQTIHSSDERVIARPTSSFYTVS